VLEALGVAALVLAALSAAFLSALVVRRVTLARAESRRAELELRLRPRALAIVDGVDVDPEPLDTEELALLAEVIGRLSRSVRGDARDRIAAYFAGTRALADELEALRDRRPWRRATAAYRLGDMACGEAVEPLLPALDDPDDDVRAAAARSLGLLGAPVAAEPLVRALAQSRVPRAIAFRAVLDLGDAALPELRPLAEAPDPDVRAAAVEVIGYLGGAGDAGLLVGAAEDPSAEVRARAAAALGRLAATEGAAALTRALDDRIYFVRLHAARALGKVGEEAAVERLLRQAREDRFEAARAAAEAVALIDPDALVAAAAEPDAGPHLHEAADLLRA
jgi:HEAT repeat protein